MGDRRLRTVGLLDIRFEKSFSVTKCGFCDFVAGNGEQGASATSKWRLENKEQVMRAGGVVHYRINL